MTKQTRAWVEGARPLADFSTRNAIFSLSSPELSRERSYDRTVLRFTAKAERTFTEGGFELSNIYVVLVDADGAPIVRRSHDSGRQTLLGPLTTWCHEIHDDQLAAAAAMVYEVETRVDHRRVILEGDLAALDLDSGDRQPWPLAITSAPADPLLQLSVRTLYNRGDFEIFLAGEATDVHDGHRHDFELDLRDEAGAVIAARTLSFSLNATGFGMTDSSQRLEKKVVRAVRKVTLRCRSEVRSIARLGPFQIAS